ncbi:MAG TPA: SRPBCC domain-containing protein [Nocardioidaceae bacterium]|nr:SRPBCC domain-containing protein [Nocardioidaceae bacterium]
MAKELHIERVFDAPRELVWKAFTDPDQISQWFGPVGYSVPRDSVDIDLRVGGHQRLTMVPDDPSYPPGGPSEGVFEEVVENELLVAHEDLSGEMAELFGAERITMRIELHDEEGKTRLVLRQGPYKDDFVGNARDGWNSSFTKLDALLAG